jgi:hypothetical protein
MRVVIRNWYLVAAAVMGISGGLGIYWEWTPSLLAWGGLVIFTYSVWLLFLEGRGIIIENQMLSIPTRPSPWLPIFALTRVRLPMEQVSDITYAGSWMGMEHVLLNRQSDRQTLIFHTFSPHRRRARCHSAPATPHSRLGSPREARAAEPE